VRLVKEALRDCGFHVNLTVASDGEEAVQLLFGGSPERPSVRPHVILLDVNLPKKSGHEVFGRRQTGFQPAHHPRNHCQFRGFQRRS
jgi:CheY-like chemotaxis protein